jgi:hypothetical protein
MKIKRSRYDIARHIHTRHSHYWLLSSAESINTNNLSDEYEYDDECRKLQRDSFNFSLHCTNFITESDQTQPEILINDHHNDTQ